MDDKSGWQQCWWIRIPTEECESRRRQIPFQFKVDEYFAIGDILWGCFCSTFCFANNVHNSGRTSAANDTTHQVQVPCHEGGRSEKKKENPRNHPNVWPGQVRQFQLVVFIYYDGGCCSGCFELVSINKQAAAAAGKVFINIDNLSLQPAVSRSMVKEVWRISPNNLHHRRMFEWMFTLIGWIKSVLCMQLSLQVDCFENISRVDCSLKEDWIVGVNRTDRRQ